MDSIEGLELSLKNLASARVSKILDSEGFEEAEQEVHKLTEAYKELIDVYGESGKDLTNQEILDAIDLMVELGLETEFATEVLMEFTSTATDASVGLADLKTSLDETSKSVREMSDSVENLDSLIDKLVSGKGLSNKIGRAHV